MQFDKPLCNGYNARMNINFPIDLVYLWCDGNDPEFKKKKKAAYEKYRNVVLDKEGTSDFRFIDMEELKYSLRSAEKYAPWIRNIYIVTYEQVPEWLNVNHPKIHIIDHKDIIPAQYLPTFNSSAIEVFLAKIPGLSEHFIFANDDMFFWGEVGKDFFFDEKGTPYCRTRKRITKEPVGSQYGTMVYNSYKLILDKFGKDTPYWSHHGIDAYRKSDYLECIECFKEDFNRTASHTFREETDIQRAIINYYALAQKGAILKEFPYKWYDKIFTRIDESCYSSCTKKKIKRFKNKKFKLFCINDGRKTKDSDRLYMKNVLEEKFPQKSAYEL